MFTLIFLLRNIVIWQHGVQHHIFLDSVTYIYDIHEPLNYVLVDDPVVPNEADDALELELYFGVSGSLCEELIRRLVHTGAIYGDDNTSILIKIEKAMREITVESTVRAFLHHKDGHGAFQAIITNHTGDTKYHVILRKCMNLLQLIKWSDLSYPLETFVSNYR